MDEQGRNPDKILLISAFIMVSACLLIGLIGQAVNPEGPKNVGNHTEELKNFTVAPPPLSKKISQQPGCKIIEALESIYRDVHFKKTSCRPGDKINNNKKRVIATSTEAVCIIMDLMDFKGNSKQTKTPLSRKCSLADLTVLKHQRKELVRRESILEETEENSYNQMGIRRPPPLHRRCSFPVGTTRNNYQFNSVDIPPNISRPNPDGRRSSIIHDSRRASIAYDSQPLDGRRQSLLLDSMDRRISVDDRRHHVRFVHRH